MHHASSHEAGSNSDADSKNGTDIESPDGEGDLAAYDVAPSYAGQSSYGSRDNYWETRYQDAAPTKDWYGTWDCFGKAIMAALPPCGMRVLHVGSGTSLLPEEMHKMGYINQLATDISPSVVSTMRHRTAHCSGLRWSVEDAVAPRYPVGSFDAVVDKGTFDALSCSGQGYRLIEEMGRVIAPGGVYIMISSLTWARRVFCARDIWSGVETLHVAEHGGEGFVHVATRAQPTQP
jgi:SAM-dependent methyltransferase